MVQRFEGTVKVARGLAAVAVLSALSGLATAQQQVPSNLVMSYGRVSTFSYVASGATKGMLATESVEEPGARADLCVLTSYGYDAFGNKNSATTSNCSGASSAAQFTTRSSGTSYGADGLFPRTATNALNQSETRDFDYRFGAPISLTGPNSLTTTFTIDDFGRKTRELRADGTSTVTAYCYLSGLDQSSNSGAGDPVSCPAPAAGEAPADAVSFTHTEPRGGGSPGSKMGAFVRVYLDKLGRQLRTVTESFDGAGQTGGYSLVLIVQDTYYSATGVKIGGTQPYFLNSGGSTLSGNNNRGSSIATVDVLGRPISVVTSDPNGNLPSPAEGNVAGNTMGQATRQTIVYQGLSTTITVTKSGSGLVDQAQTRVEEKDINGNVIRITDSSGAQLVRHYDAFNNLIETRDALQNATTIGYDYRGRKVAMNDPDAGASAYTYNALGELKSTQTAKGSIATMTYDVLGRMTQRVEPEYTSTWTYDSCTKGVGKLCSSGTNNGITRTLVYDSLGRPINTRLDIVTGTPPKPGFPAPTTSFASAVSYDGTTGRVATQTYPTGLQVSYSYTAQGGYLEKLSTNTALVIAGNTVAAGTPLWQATAVNAWGKAEQSVYANGVWNTSAFEAATGRVTGLRAGPGAGGNSVMNQDFTWDSLGNLTGRIDRIGDTSTTPVSGEVSETFLYEDGINRLTKYTVSSATIPGSYREVNLAYNALGLLLNKSDVGSYAYPTQGGARPHALQSVAGAITTGYTYDANGNVITATGAKYSALNYTSFNMPIARVPAANMGGIENGSTNTQYGWSYDENHQRLKEERKNASGTRTTWMLHPDSAGGLGFESESGAALPDANRHFLSVGGQSIGVLISSTSLPTLATGQTAPAVLSSITLTKVEFWHKDHLGSIVATTNQAGTVTARYAYDPFGKRRFTNGSYDEFGNIVVSWSAGGTGRGFTGHEQLDDVGLVHMNGRVFDPTTGRFLQPDPLVQSPSNLQNFDRYGYCFNGPLGCTDPTGLSFLGDLFSAVRGLTGTVAGGVVDAWHGVWRNPITRTVVIIVAAYYGGAWASDMYASGQAATAGYSAAASAEGAAITSGLGEAAAELAYDKAYTMYYEMAYSAAQSSVTGSAISGAASGFTGAFVASNGNLKAGIQGAASGALSGSVSGYYGASYPAERILANGVAGGMGSVIRGGSFSDGFRSSALVSSLTYLNWQMRQTMIAQSRINSRNDGTGLSQGMLWDGFKLAGGRFDPAPHVGCSPLGCDQNGPGSILGISYPKGGIVDMVTESFAGPHDFANNPWWYDKATGNIRDFSQWSGAQLTMLELTTNYTTSLLFAAPFAISAVFEQTYAPSYSYWARGGGK